MKFPPKSPLAPKLIGSLLPNATGGFAKARALDNVDAPYLTATGPGFITRKKNGFTEVEVLNPAAPPVAAGLWWPGGTAAALLSPTGRPRARARPQTHVAPLGVIVQNSGGTAAWVGAGRIAHINQGFNSSALANSYWPVLALPKSSAEVEVGNLIQPKRSVALIGYAQTDAGRLYAPVATGWDGSCFRWVSFLEPNTSFYTNIRHDGKVVTGRIRALHDNLANTPDPFATSLVALPTKGGRKSVLSEVFCAGPGKLIALIAFTRGAAKIVTDRSTYPPGGNQVVVSSHTEYPLAHTSPALCTSNDHGETWTLTDTSLLDPYLLGYREPGGYVPSQPTPGGWEGNPYYDGAGSVAPLSDIEYPQVFDGARSFTCTYIGRGVSIVTIGGVGRARSDTLPYTHPRGQFLCFQYDGSTFSPLAWPVSATKDHGYGLSQLYGRVCFGPGCFAVYAYTGTVGSTFSGLGVLLRGVLDYEDPGLTAIRILLTYDFGASWYATAVLPFGVGSNAGAPAVVTPYISETSPGVLLITTADGGQNQLTAPADLSIWKLSGSMDSIKRTGATGLSAVGTTAIPFLKRTKVNLALPDEFNPP